jgi:membrane-bound lytic murein transglycosylase D
VPEEQPNAERQTPEIIDEPKKDAPEMASAIVDEPVKSEEVKNEKVAIDTAMQTAEANVTATVTPVEDALKSDTTEAFASADTTAPATVAKKEDIEYDVVQPEPIVENNKKDVAETVSAIEQPKEEPRQADTIESVPPVAATIAPVAKETTTVKAPEKVSLPVEEPKDEYAKLKARLDKVVYASDNTIAEVEKPKKEEEKKPVDTKRLENTKKEVAADPAANKKDASKFYTVKKGDTAFSIAKKNNITMRQLMDWNKLDFKTIKVGQELRVK